MYSVEVVNKLVMNGLSFRDAYKKIGQDILEGNYVVDKNVAHTHEGSIGHLCLDEIRDKMEKVVM